MPKRVPAVGPKDAKVFLLGESPGAKEVRFGRPFVGPSGELLNEILQGVGLRRSEIYISNTVKYEPPHVDKDKFFFPKKTKKGLGPPSQVYLEGIAEVAQEIQEVKPNVVVPMGSYALWALTQLEGVFKWRGSILESTIVPGQKVIPTIHPAWFLNTRMWYKLPLLEWDFARIAEESQSPDLNLPNPEIIIDPSPAQMEEAIERFTQGQMVASDTEWYSPNKLAYIGFSDSPDYAVVIPNTSHFALRAYRAILGSGVPIVMQNAMFDTVALHRLGIDVKNLVHDTMIAWHYCWTDLRQKDLGTIASCLTRHPFYKDEVEFVGQDDEQGQHYCGKDCVVTLEGWEKIEKNEFEITGGRRGYEISMSIFEPFLEASKMGIRVDDERRNELKKMYIEKADEIEDALSKTLGRTFNPNSGPQTIKLVFDELLPAFGIKRTKRTSRQEHLMDIAASYSHIEEIKLILGAIIRCRQNRNIVSRYLHDGIIDKDGRCRTNWNLAGTRSGRLSSTIPWWPGLPLQTIPEDARAIFIPDPGHIFVGFDQAQAEARVVAVLTYDHDLLDDMENGVDIHTKLAAALPFGKTYEQLIQEIAEMEAKKRSKDEVRERYIAKKSRHAFNYVEGPDTFRLHLNREWIDTGIGIDTTTARNIRKRYLELSPGLEPWWGEVHRTMGTQGYIDNAFGRRRLCLGRITDDSIREMVSFFPQSSVSDLTTLAIADLWKSDPWIQPLVHAHDGALFQVPEERRDEAVQKIVAAATRPMRVRNEQLVIPIEAKVGYSWQEMEKVESP